MPKIERVNTAAALEPLVGKQVTVAVTSKHLKRAGFDTQMSVVGILEQNSDADDKYRVVAGEGTFAYFDVHDVHTVAIATVCPAVIFVRISDLEDVAESGTGDNQEVGLN